MDSPKSLWQWTSTSSPLHSRTCRTRNPTAAGRATPKLSTTVTAEAPACLPTSTASFTWSSVARVPFHQEEIRLAAGLAGGADLVRRLVEQLLARPAEVVALVLLADAVPDHDVPDAELQHSLHAAGVPGDVEIERELPPQDGPHGLQPAGHREEQLHAPDADQRQRLGDPHLVVHGERHVGALLAVPHGDVVQGHGVRGHLEARVEVVRATVPVGLPPGLVGVRFH